MRPLHKRVPATPNLVSSLTHPLMLNWWLMSLEIARILRETGSASDHLSKTDGLIVLNLTGCAQLGGDQAKAEQLLSTRCQT